MCIRDRGWGQSDETWSFLDALGRLGGETWFNIGDRDLATHILRTSLLQAGATPSEVVEELCRRMNIAQWVVPMSDQTVSTRVQTKSGEDLMFQHYFVRDRCEPEVAGFEFEGIGASEPSPGFSASLASCDVAIICPSNPYLSIDPILSVPGIRDALGRCGAPVVAVSPVVSGDSLKGPTAKIMNELGIICSATAIAQHYHGLIDGLLIDTDDASLEADIADLGIAVKLSDIVMRSAEERCTLAKTVVQFAGELRCGVK